MNPMIPLLCALHLLPIGSGPVQDDPALELSAPLDEVTVYPEGARCEHPARIESSFPRGGTGWRDARFARHLPLHHRRRTLLQSSLGLVTIPPGAEARSEHQRLLDEQLQRVRIAERAAESARSSLELLDSMGRTMSEQVDFTDPEAIRTLHAFLSEQREVAILAVDEGERTLATETRRLSELEAASARLHRGTRQLQAELLVNAETAGPADLLATCFVEEAGWTPQVRISRSNAGDEAQVELLADVTNDTDLDWEAVALRLSTERPRSFEPPAEISLAGIDKAPKDDDEVRPREEASGPTPYEPLRAVHQTTQRTTIDHGLTRSVLLERFRTPCTLRHHVRPTVDDSCHILSTLRNESPRLISAAPVTLFIDGRMVGRTRIDDVAPGDGFTISWGIRPNLRITRDARPIDEVIGPVVDDSPPAVPDPIRNLEPEPLVLIVEDRLPTALSSEITVKGSDFAPHRGLGRDRWGTAGLGTRDPAGGPEAAPQTIEWTVEVTHSADLETTLIPE